MTRENPTKPVLSTMWAPGDPDWDRLVEVLPARDLTVRDLVHFLRVSPRRRAVLFRGSVSARDRYRDLVLALVMRLTGRRSHIVISDATWEPRSRSLEERAPLLARAVPSVARTFIRALDAPSVSFGVLSSSEVDTLREVWGLKKANVVFTPFSHTMYGAHRDVEVTDAGHLFAGGNSLRDYPLLVEAIKLAGGVPTNLATSWTPSQRPAWLTCGTVPHEEFISLLASCRASVVPIAQSVRSAGQQTYLNAMVLGKPVVVTEAPGVADYIEHGVTGLVVPPRADALAEAVSFVMGDANRDEVMAMGARAREWVLANATPKDYRQRLLALAVPSEIRLQAP